MSNDPTKGTEQNIVLGKKEETDDRLKLPRTAKHKSFARHDASYVCTVCKAKFFTKVDVEEHFFKHPLAG